MVAPVDGTEIKLRGFEAPLVARIATDQVATFDGPVTGPGSVTLSVLGRDSLGSLPGPTAPVNGVTNPRVPVIFQDVNGLVQAANYSLAEISAGGGSMYLGPKADPPTTDNFGGPLIPGHMYYNTNDETLYVWSSGGRWVLSAASLPAAMKVFYYSYSTPGSMVPPGGPNTPDALGNILSFDISSGQASISGVNVYLNGVLLVNGSDYVVHEGGAGGDYITLSEEACASSVLVVQLFTTGVTTFAPNSVKLNTSGWVFDGIVRTFPLVDYNNAPVFPGNAVNCMMVRGTEVLEPNVKFTANGDSITFVEPPLFGDYVWGIVGVPTSGAEGEKGTRVSPWDFGGFGDGASDDSDAVETAINQANATRATLDLSGGIWRITRQMPSLLYPRVDGSGSGEIYVDYNMAGAAVIDCRPVLGDVYTVTAHAFVVYDFEGALSDETMATRLTLALAAGQVMPKLGAIGKMTATDQILGVEVGDQVGQHLVIDAVDATNFYVYSACPLIDGYTAEMQLQMLGHEPVMLQSFAVRANWDRLVAEDWNGSFIQIMGAIQPRVNDVWVRNGAQGITFIGCYQNQSRGIRVGMMRNATASETPAIPGYGVVDGGCYEPVHTDLSGFKARHLYTTISPDAATWHRVAWGRTFRTVLIGGAGANCSAAAFDTHSDAFEPTFIGLIVLGGYFGQNSAGAGLQLRGVRGKMIGCRVSGTEVGFEIYKQFAGEAGGHALTECEYRGRGTAIRVEHDDGLLGVNAQQSVIIGDFHGRTTAQIGIDCADATIYFEGVCRIVNIGNTTDARALYMRAATSAFSRGGKLIFDLGEMAGGTTPRLITYVDALSSAKLDAEVIAGATNWQAVVSENEGIQVPVPAGAFVIDCEVSKAPAAASGGYSQNGGGNLLPTGALVLRMTLNGARTPAARTANFTLNASLYRQVIVCTAAITVTVPSVNILGPEFMVTLIAAGGTVAVDGPGATNGSIASGSVGVVRVANGKSWVSVQAMTDLT